MNTPRRHRIGRELMSVSQTTDSVVLEGTVRLRPGEIVALVDVPSGPDLEERRAVVESWAVARLGKNGTIYRGVCRWVESRG